MTDMYSKGFNSAVRSGFRLTIPPYELHNKTALYTVFKGIYLNGNK